VDGFEALDDVTISDKELLMAKSLVEALSEDFQPSDYRDEYRIAVEDIIEQKAAGKTPVFEDAPAARATVIDLASALEASLRTAKEARAHHPTATGHQALKNVTNKKTAISKKATATAATRKSRSKAAAPKVRKSA
jgi:DNA end-binding protein Ku